MQEAHKNGILEAGRGSLSPDFVEYLNEQVRLLIRQNGGFGKLTIDFMYGAPAETELIITGKAGHQFPKAN